MALIPYEPFRHLDNMRRELDHYFTTSGNPAGLLGGFDRRKIDVEFH